MAERGAHLTSAVTPGRPSIFEVLAQDSLMMTIRPALKHAVRILAESKPEKCGWLLKYYHELYTAFAFIVQHNFLLKYCGSFSENFYGLKRIASGDISGKRLTKPLHYRSLVCLVVLPYIKQKLEDWYEEYRQGYNTDSDSSSSTIKEAFNRMLMAVYPYIHALWEGCHLYYQLMFMFAKSQWHSPLLHLSGTELNNLVELSSDKPDLFSWKDSSFQTKMLHIFRTFLSGIAVTISTCLSVGVFFLQFLDWWYASDSDAPSLLSLPTPDPPQETEKPGLPSPAVCPLCRRRRKNDTAVSVSGYVFCYLCINTYVKQNGCCPVTGYPVNSEHLVRLYPPDS